MDILQVLRKIELKINSYNRIDVEKKNTFLHSMSVLVN